MDSNHRPLPCQGSALTRLSYGPTRKMDNSLNFTGYEQYRQPLAHSFGRSRGVGRSRRFCVVLQSGLNEDLIPILAACIDSGAMCRTLEAFTPLKQGNENRHLTLPAVTTDKCPKRHHTPGTNIPSPSKQRDLLGPAGYGEANNNEDCRYPLVQAGWAIPHPAAVPV